MRRRTGGELETGQRADVWGGVCVEVGGAAEHLRQGAQHFQRQSDDMRRLLWWRNFKMKCIVFLLLFSVVGYAKLWWKINASA